MALRSTTARAASCRPLLDRLLNEAEQGIYVVMLTLNDEAVASFTETRLYGLRGSRRPGRPIIAPSRFKTVPKNFFNFESPKFDFGEAVQTFSNRVIVGTGAHGTEGLPHRGLQKFDEARADSLDVEIQDLADVRVTITPRNANAAKTTFTASCEDDRGFLVGATDRQRFLLWLEPFGLQPH